MAATLAKLATTKIIMAILVCSSFICSISARATAQEIAFAFTDTLSPSTGLDGLARAEMLVNSLKRIDVPPSMFLIRTANINSKTIARMEFYEEAGQLLINAGHNESPLSRKTEQYRKMDIAKANAILSQYTNYYQHVHLPYLYEDGDSATLGNLLHYFAEHNYQPSYTTYQAADDYFDSIYQAQLAAGRSVNLEKLKQAYVNFLLDDISAYSAQALLHLGYYPRQVILLHETDLTAYSIVNLVDALIEKGFTIISPEKIFSDPVANPFFLGGYSATGYMRAITGLGEPKRNNLYLISDAEKQKIHSYLAAQGLEHLISDRETVNAQ